MRGHSFALQANKETEKNWVSGQTWWKSGKWRPLWRSKVRPSRRWPDRPRWRPRSWRSPPPGPRRRWEPASLLGQTHPVQSPNDPLPMVAVYARKELVNKFCISLPPLSIATHSVVFSKSRKNEIMRHNSPIYDECQTQWAKVLTLPWKRAHQDDSNDTPQPICECQVDFPLLWIKDYPGLS